MLRLLRRKEGVLHQTKTSNLYDLLERILNKGMFIRGGKYSRQADPPDCRRAGVGLAPPLKADSGRAIHQGMNLLYRSNTRTNRGASPAENNPLKRWPYRLLYD